MLEVDGVLHW
jgi:hypothetical protein